MVNYTGYQYLLIDIANQYGLDKLIFEDRIQWATERLQELETHADRAECPPLYKKAVAALRKAQAGQPTGHMVGVDACCSGIQVLSVLTGCINGATATGLVDPDRRADAYTQTTETMNGILGGGLTVTRKAAKQALMTSFYGSRKTPKDIFGEDTPELNAFYQAAQQVAPGAWELLQDLLAAWQPYALSHEWKLPDGFDAKVKVLEKKETRIEVDELDHATFTYEYYDNLGMKKGISLPANVTHSVDAYILREMHRRCNYDREMAITLQYNINMELAAREDHGMEQKPCSNPKVQYYIDQYIRSGIASMVIMPHLMEGSCTFLDTAHLEKLLHIVTGMLTYVPFPLVTVHDEFKAHANHLNQVRWQYKEILAELADSHLIDDLLSQIHGKPGQFSKLSRNLGDLIRNSNYGLS